MITTGIIREVGINKGSFVGNAYKVELNIFQIPGDYNKNNYTYIANCSTIPGLYNSYSVGDVVYVGFLNNDKSIPIILGKIYQGLENKQGGYLNLNGLNVNGQVKLPKNTKIGDITGEQIFELFKNNNILRSDEIVIGSSKGTLLSSGKKIITSNDAWVVNNETIPTTQMIFDNIIELLEGKTQTYVVSDLDNPIFDSQEDIIEIPVVENILTTNNAMIDYNKLRIGDIFYVIETDVPDRWVCGFKDKIEVPNGTLGHSTQDNIPTISNPVAVISDIYKDIHQNIHELRSVGTYSDIYNEGILTRNIGIKIFNGTEEWTDGGNDFYSRVDGKVNGNVTLMSNYFQDNELRKYATVNVGIYKAALAQEQIATPAQMQAWCLEKYQNGQPLIIYYPLATPITENINLYIFGDRTGIELSKLETQKIDKQLMAVSGFDGTKTQTLKNINGSFIWVDD